MSRIICHVKEKSYAKADEGMFVNPDTCAVSANRQRAKPREWRSCACGHDADTHDSCRSRAQSDSDLTRLGSIQFNSIQCILLLKSLAWDIRACRSSSRALTVRSSVRPFVPPCCPLYLYVNVAVHNDVALCVYTKNRYPKMSYVAPSNDDLRSFFPSFSKIACLPKVACLKGRLLA